jgi:20S proteasome alpha/beta subunit
LTVCVAAICGSSHEDGPFVVTAADRMITIAEVEYEPAQTKSERLASQTLALLAGDMTFHAAVIPRVKERITAELQEHPHNIDVSRIAELYAEEYGLRRRVLAEQAVLIPRGLSFDRFASRQGQMAHYQVASIDADLVTYYIGARALIAGIDSTGGHIFMVDNPGVCTSFDVPGFACIGSGEPLARTQFMVHGYNRFWPIAPAIWMTFDAKARAQKAGGVGRETDLHIIRRGGRIDLASDDDKALLYKLFEETMAKETEAARQASEKINEHIINSARAPNEAATGDQTGGPEAHDRAPPTGEKTKGKSRKTKKKRARSGKDLT